MSLTLNVLSFKNQPITGIPTVFIGNAGGSIGRSDDNTLMLPDADKFVSRHHATIRFENSAYYLSDTSLSGVYVNGAEKPLNNATVRLDNGTQLRIGEYDIAVTIACEPIVNDVPVIPDSIASPPKAFLGVDEPWVDLGLMDSNSLMADNFPRHDELVQSNPEPRSVAFESRLQGNNAPIFDSYIAPDIIQTPAASPVEVIPENISFDDFFAETTVEKPSGVPYNQVANKPTVSDDFDDFFGAAISNMAADINPSPHISDTSTDDIHDGSVAVDVFTGNPLADEPLLTSNPIAPAESIQNDAPPVEETPAFSDTTDFFASKIPIIADAPAVFLPATEMYVTDVIPETDVQPTHNSKPDRVLVTENTAEKYREPLVNSRLFKAFLQGAAVECKDIQLEQQAEVLHRIGGMFRQLIDGTVAVLRSRAAFKSECRVNMTVIKAKNNNPLKFTVSTDDVLRQLIENKTEGFIASTTAIDEAFNDIMHHQLAMQAGIQASLSDLLATFDPKIIEKQFEQGFVLQKKSKCWDRYEETYRNTVDDAVENFFGDAFVTAYEQQMDVLTKTRSKQQGE